jgi:hypothetical protein
MVNQSETQLGAQISKEFFEISVVKLLAIIHGDFVWYTETTYDVLPKEFLLWPK